MRNCWRSLELPLLNYEIELDLRWVEDCLISEISRTTSVAEDNSIEATAIFQINNAKLYFPVFTLPLNDNMKFLKHLKQ